MYTAQASQPLFEKSDRKYGLFKLKIIRKDRQFPPKYRLLTGKNFKNEKKLKKI